MRRIVLIVAIALLAGPAGAQVQYGTVSGVVVEADGTPLPGVTVRLAGPAMPGQRVAVTDPQGRFRFVPVPPGQGYALVFALDGFNSLEQTGVVVNVDKDTAMRAEMAPSQFAETLTVTAERLIVDTTRSTVETTVDWGLMDDLTTTRHYNSVFQMAPGVQLGQNNPAVNGSAGDDNLILMDGVDTNDPRTNTWGTQINYDSIQEVAVQTGGFSAEYGRATGGVLNLITKSGGNTLTFSGRVIKSDADWAARPGIDAERGVSKTAQQKRSELRPSATLGGPLLRDALWFYLSYERRDRETTFGRYLSAADAAAGVATEETSTYAGHFFSGKLTWQASPSHSLVGYFNEDPIEFDNANGWGYYGPNFAASAENIQVQGGDNASLQWYGAITPEIFMETRVQRTRGTIDYVPQTYSAWNEQPFLYDWDIDYYSGAPWEAYRSARDRDGVLVTGSYFLDTSSSSHHFKAGAEWLDIKPRAGWVYNTAGYFQTRDGLPFRRNFYSDQVGPQPTKGSYLAVFAQDSWTFGRLTLNLGVRAESYKGETNVGDVVLDFGLGDQVAPRLGFAYDLNGDVVRGSVSRFYDLPTDYVAATMSSTPTLYERWTWNGSCAFDGGSPISGYPDQCWDLAWRIPIGESGYTVDPGLDPIYVDEITLGYEHLVTPQMGAGLTYIWRRQDRGIDDVDPEYDGIYEWTNVPVESLSPGTRWKEYQALEMSLRKRFGPDGVQLAASYTYVLRSRGWPNTGGSESSDSLSQRVGYGDNPDLFNPLWYGKLESPHLVKAFGSWTAPWKTVFGLSAYWTSGNLYTRYDPLSGAYDNVPLERLNSSRVGNNWEADLHLEQPFAVGPVTMAVYADVFNVFNNQQATDRSGNSANSSVYTLPTRWQSPRQVQLGFKIEY